MIVRLDVSVLNENCAFDNLDRLFPLLEDGRHTWCVLQTEEIYSSEWYKSHADRWKRRIQTVLDNAKPMVGKNRLLPVIVVGHSVDVIEDFEWCVSPEQAWNLLRQPLRLVVEDGESDSAFLQALFFRFGEQRLERKLGRDEWSKVKEKWAEKAGDDCFFKIIHAGGSRVGDIIKTQWGLSPLSLIAVVDSDRRSPSQSHEMPKQGSTWHFAAEASNNVTPVTLSTREFRPIVFALPRREMENYLPHESLADKYRSNPQKKCVDAYTSIDKNQRYFYDLKRGFRDSLNQPSKQSDDSGERANTEVCSLPPSDWAWKDEEQRSLYETLSPDTLKSLCGGLGRNVWQCWEQPGASINKTTMNKEAGDELNRLLDTILNCL